MISVHPKIFHCKTNCLARIHWWIDTVSPAINVTSCFFIASAPSGCEAGRGGVHITRRDDLHFRWWVHQVGSALQLDRRGCWVGWSIEDYWVIWQGGGWSLLGGVFSYHELEWNWTGFCGKVKNPTLISADGLMPPTRLVASKFL